MNEVEDIARQREREQKLKAMAETCQQSTKGSCGDAGMLAPARDSLLDRVRARVDRAKRESVKYERLAELQYLLDKHPEVARILELMEEM